MKSKNNFPISRCGHRYLAWVISCNLAAWVFGSGPSYAREYFNPELLAIGAPDAPEVDLTTFEEGGQPPGRYRVDVYLNNEIRDTWELDFFLRENADQKSLQPCLSSEQIASLGIKENYLQGINSGDGSCLSLADLVPGATTNFVFNQQRLDLTLPQATIDQQARGYVPPESWDSGIPAFLLNYDFDGATTRARKAGSQDSSNYYLNLHSGLNLGAWRLRNYSTWNATDKGETNWDSINSFLQRDIVTLKGQLTLGDSSSPSDVFDSVPFRGGQLASDDEMLPESLKGFAPVVRGVARSNAQVTIRQNGYVIYQSYVAPGAFEIADLYPTAGSGDLELTIRESDGSEQRIIVPYATVPVLQREGRLKYSLTGGQYRAVNDGSHPNFAQLTAIYGLPFGSTIYGGAQTASQYQAFSLGWGQNLGSIGALSTDITQSRYNPDNREKEQGRSWRVRYGKSFAETGTNFSLASYRYSTRGFYTFQEAVDAIDQGLANNRKSRAEAAFSQSLGRYGGSLSFNIIDESYWDGRDNTRSASFGYNNSWENITFGVNYTYSQNGTDSNGNAFSKPDQIIALNVNISLDKWLPGAYANYNGSSSRNNGATHNVGLNGTTLQDNNLSYSINQGYNSQNKDVNGNLSADYKGGQGQVRAGYSYDSTQQRINYGVQGGVVVHGDGITFSQSLGETIALVKAPGLKHTRLENETGVQTDWRGYAVVPYLSPYRRNSVALQTDSLPNNVDVQGASKNTVPTRGAVARVEFKTHVGLRVLMTLRQANGMPVPFGAMAAIENSQAANSSIVGDDGQVYFSGLAMDGKINVSWGSSAAQKCSAQYQIAEADQNASIVMVDATCR